MTFAEIEDALPKEAVTAIEGLPFPRIASGKVREIFDLGDALLLVARQYEVIGVDLTEVDPVYDSAGVTSRIAAKLLLDFLGAIFAK